MGLTGSVGAATEDARTRHVRLQGAFNVRDLGGLATTTGAVVRPRTLLRGDALHALHDADVEWLAGIGLRTVVDLREHDERRAAPDRVWEGLRAVNVPLFGAGDGATPSDRASGEAPGGATPGTRPGRARRLGEVYAGLLERRGDAVVEAVRALAEPDALPAIVHCTMGKDRTGIVVAMLLSAIGVPEETVVRDYSATSWFLTTDVRSALVARAMTGSVGPMGGLGPEDLAPMLACGPELMGELLANVRASHGDARGYLVDHGLRGPELSRLAGALLVVPGG